MIFRYGNNSWGGVFNELSIGVAEIMVASCVSEKMNTGRKMVNSCNRCREYAGGCWRGTAIVVKKIVLKIV